MKFQTITAILVFLLIGVASVSLPVTVSAATPTVTPTPTTVSTTISTTQTTTPTLTATLTTSLPTTTVPTPTIQGGHSTGPLAWAGTGNYVSDPIDLSQGVAKLSVTADGLTSVSVLDSNTGNQVGSTQAGPGPGSNAIPIPATGKYLVNVVSPGTWTASILSVGTPTSIQSTVVTTLPTVFVTNVTFQSQTPTLVIVETVNPNYTPATYPIDLSTSRTPDIDSGMPAYDGPVPTPTTAIPVVTPTNSSTPMIVIPVNTSVEIPVRTVERLENISNVSPYQTYTPAPTPAPPKGPDLLKILLLALLAIAGGGGIALLSRSYRGRQQEPGEDVPLVAGPDANPEDGRDVISPEEASIEGQVTLDQIADYDPATTEVRHLMEMLDRLVQNSQKSLHNPTLRIDDLIRLSGISTLPIPERVAQWGADHGYVVVSRDFQNEALLFRQTPVPGEPDLGIMYIGDLIGENDIPPAPDSL